MLGSTPISAVLGAAPPATADTAALKSFAKAAVGAGLALLLIAPGTKIPVDMRTQVQRNKDDKAAAEQARADGVVNWHKTRSLAGSHLATTDPTIICRYIDRYRKLYGEDVAVNFAVETGASNLVVVDCDTAEQVAAFLEDAGSPTGVPPTVVTPGALDADGNWVHKDGGHFYFTTGDSVDEVLPPGAGTWTAPGGYAVMWNNRYVLIPPSVRPEGGYLLTGREYDLPDWIRERIVEHSTRLFERELARMNGFESSDLTESIDRWASETDWDAILSPFGWTLTSRTDRCGCGVWTAPGDHGSPKSATTHGVGCERTFENPLNAPMHIWTDNPGEELEAWVAEHGKTISKLQLVAVLYYGGNVGSAVAELGLLPEGGKAFDGASSKEVEQDAGVSKDNAAEEIQLPDKAESAAPAQSNEDEIDCANFGHQWETRGDGLFFCTNCASDEGPEESPLEDDPDTAPDLDTEGTLISDIPGVPIIRPFDDWRDLEAPEYAIEGLIENHALTCIVGAPNTGKSTLAIDMACHLVTGQRWHGRRVIKQKVLYLAGEGLNGAVQRIKAWELAHGLDVGKDLLLGDSILQVGAKTEAWAVVAGHLLQHQVGLIIFDTYARMSLALEENSASDAGKAILRFDQIRRLTGAGVMVIHHTGKVGDSGRGSNALNAAIDSELLLKPGSWDSAEFDEQHGFEPVDLWAQKQKNDAKSKEPLPLLLTPMHGSVVMTGPGGTVGDPMDTAGVAPMLIAEPLVETAIRLRAFAGRYPVQGVTRGEFVSGVEPDKYTASRKNAAARWKRTVAEAVDLGLRYRMLETLSGTASGSRYITGGDDSDTTPEAARVQAASEVITE